MDMYPDGNGRGTLEIVDQDWNSHFWDQPFSTAEEAMRAGVEAIETEGIDTFVGPPIQPALH
jgi:hypothetical protein